MLLFRETQNLGNAPVYLSFVAREANQDHHWDYQAASSDYCAFFYSDDLQYERARNLWMQEIADARDAEFFTLHTLGVQVVFI